MAARPRGDRPTLEGLVGVPHHQVHVYLELGTESIAALAGAVRRIEREVPGRQLFVALAIYRAGQVLREGEDLVFALSLSGRQLHLGHTLGQGQRRLQRLGEAALDALPLYQAVYDHLDVVDLVAGQIDLGTEVIKFAVHPGPHITLGGQISQQGLVVALAAAHDGGQNLEPSALGQLEYPVHDLLRRLAGDDHTMLRAMGYPNAGEQQPEVVVDLGHRADSGPWVLGCRLLVYGDGGRQTFDEVDIGLVHLAEELPGIRRQRFHIAALAFCIDRVEGQRGFPRPRQAGEDNELVSGQVDRDISQVVFSGAADHEGVRHEGRAYRHPTRPRRTPVLYSLAQPYQIARPLATDQYRQPNYFDSALLARNSARGWMSHATEPGRLCAKARR